MLMNYEEEFVVPENMKRHSELTLEDLAGLQKALEKIKENKSLQSLLMKK